MSTEQNNPAPELPESVRQAIPAIAERAFKAHKQSVGDYWAHEDAICENQAEDFAMQVACELLPLWPKAEGDVPDATTYTKSYSGKGYFEDNPLAYITIMVGHRELVRVPSSLLKELLRDLVEVDGWPTSAPSPVAGLPTVESGPVKIERTCYCCSKCGLVAAYEEQPCPLCAARAEVEALKTLWTEMRVVLAQSRDANCLCSYGATQVDAVQAANKMLNVMPKDVQSELASLRAQLATAKEEMDRTYKKCTGRDYMHLPLSEAVWAVHEKLEADLARANAAVEALNTADNDISFARGLIAEGQPQDADGALNDAINRIRSALAAQQSVPPEARAVEGGSPLRTFHIGWSNPGGYGELTVQARGAEEAARLAEIADIPPEAIDVVQVDTGKRTHNPPGEREEWAKKAAMEYLAPAETLQGEVPQCQHVDLLRAIILKHFAARPTAAREDAELTVLRETIKAIEGVNVNEFGGKADLAISRLIESIPSAIAAARSANKGKE